jgi:hypothetical protein
LSAEEITQSQKKSQSHRARSGVPDGLPAEANRLMQLPWLIALDTRYGASFNETPALRYYAGLFESFRTGNRPKEV